MRKTVVLAAALSMVAGLTSASETMPVPENCEVKASVHRDSCIVSNYVQCGDLTEVHSFLRGELTDTHIFGPDWDLVAYMADGGRTDVRVVEGSAPEASLSSALATGESLGERDLTFSTGVLKGNVLHMESTLLMSKEEIVISGQTFVTGTLSRKMTVKKNGVTSQYDFTVYATPDASLLIEGVAEVDQFGSKNRLEWTPRKIALPGEIGFGVTTSLVGCDG
ncbi:hypothetical protein SAMN05444000_10119 [Shimia gijangensis]|uniref:Lipoprotein n=1 Tax=Shimia gijangensis TaxID=1470563 RepID=A0A1M6AQT4_9RHOB|nr:hypothetical protein [Shimia gijangensis]SHI38757.1 hypothetical protein SAMN05444000_10119 [Shimia gijangensis]